MVGTLAASALVPSVGPGGLSVREASAQSKEELDRARALFREAVALSAAGNCAAAVQKYRQVAEIKMTANVAFNMGECQDKLGSLVAALGNYRLAASKIAESKPKEVEKVAQQVEGRIADLEKRIPKVTVTRSNEVGTIEIDSVEIGNAQLGSAIPVDPGTHVVIAKLNGTEVGRQTVTLAEGESKSVKLTVKLPDAPKKPKEPVEDPDPPKKEEPPPPPPSKAPAIAAIGVGVVGLALGGVFIGLAAGNADKLKAQCGGDTSCPSSAKPLADEGKTFEGVSVAMFAVGAIGVGTGIILFAVNSGKGKKEAPKDEAAPASVSRQQRPTLRFVPHAPGADVAGAGLSLKF